MNNPYENLLKLKRFILLMGNLFVWLVGAGGQTQGITHVRQAFSH
jgi:hypothetical protein